jgi:hypothetical protein
MQAQLIAEEKKLKLSTKLGVKVSLLVSLLKDQAHHLQESFPLE